MNKKHMSGYIDRAMKSRDPRYANLLGKLGYDVKSATSETLNDEPDDKLIKQKVSDDQTDIVDELKNVRAKYESVLGKKPFYGWTKEELLDRIAKAQNE